jgi:hypothetical protein
MWSVYKILEMSFQQPPKNSQAKSSVKKAGNGLMLIVEHVHVIKKMNELALCLKECLHVQMTRQSAVLLNGAIAEGPGDRD